MTLLSLDEWDVERMAISHYQGDKRESRTELWRFIRNFLARFHREAEFKATLTTPAKIQVFHTYVEEKFKHEYGRHFDEVGADAWFLAFLCFWSRNRGFVEEEVKRDPFTRKGDFYQTIKNEWDSQRGKGDSNDSILFYTITHPRLSKNPYLTIPIRIEHVRRIRVYWNKDPKILDDCRSHLKICESELEDLSEKNSLTCSAIPGTSHWLKIHVELQKDLCDLREVGKSQFRRERINYQTHKQSGKHEEIYAQVMKLWGLINHHRLSGFHFDDDVKKREEEIESFIKKVRENDERPLSEYLEQVWGGEKTSMEKMAKDVASGYRNPTPEYYLRVYFKAIMSVVGARLIEEEEEDDKDKSKLIKPKPIKPKSAELNHSLRDSIFSLPDSTYPVKTPDLGKKVRSAVRIHLIEKNGNWVEDKTKSSLINDCRDSAKLALFLLEKIQLRSGRNKNYHLSYVLWDFMFRLWTFLGVPSFTDSSKHSKDQVKQKYISANDKKLAKEIQDLIDSVFTRARFVAQPHDHSEARRSKLISIVDKWQEYVKRPLGDDSYSTNLGEIQARCGYLIGMKDKYDQRIEYKSKHFDLREKCLILFKPSEQGNMWEKGVAFGEGKGVFPIFVATSYETTGRSVPVEQERHYEF